YPARRAPRPPSSSARLVLAVATGRGLEWSGVELGQLVAVVAQEQLLERGRLTDQAADAEGAQVPHGGVEVDGVDVEGGPVVVDGQVVHPRQRVEPGGLLDGVDRDRRAGQVAQLGERAALDRAAEADDADPVAQGL